MLENKRECLTGTIVSGLNVASQFTELSWFKDQVKSYLGDDPYPGTLNLKIDVENQLIFHTILEKKDSIRIEPAAGFCESILLPIRLKLGSNRITCGIIYPFVPDYPKEKLEIISSVSLKETLSIVDGDQVQVYF